MATDTTTTTETEQTPTDIFHWANQADRYKDQLEIDLFMFTKGYTVYATNYAKELKNQLKVLFLYDMISTVQTGAATGMLVRDFEAAAAEDNVLERTTLDKVEHAQEVADRTPLRHHQSSNHRYEPRSTLEYDSPDS